MDYVGAWLSFNQSPVKGTLHLHVVNGTENIWQHNKKSSLNGHFGESLSRQYILRCICSLPLRSEPDSIRQRLAKPSVCPPGCWSTCCRKACMLPGETLGEFWLCHLGSGWGPIYVDILDSCTCSQHVNDSLVPSIGIGTAYLYWWSLLKNVVCAVMEKYYMIEMAFQLLIVQLTALDNLFSFIYFFASYTSTTHLM